MKIYNVPVEGTITVEAENEDGARETALDMLADARTERVPGVDDLIAGLEAVDGIEEVEPGPENGGCIYDHDHAQGGCEYHD